MPAPGSSPGSSPGVVAGIHVFRHKLLVALPQYPSEELLQTGGALLALERALKHDLIGQLPLLILIDIDIRDDATIVIVVDDLQVVHPGRNIAQRETPTFGNRLALQPVLAPLICFCGGQVIVYESRTSSPG